MLVWGVEGLLAVAVDVFFHASLQKPETRSDCRGAVHAVDVLCTVGRCVTL